MVRTMRRSCDSKLGTPPAVRTTMVIALGVVTALALTRFLGSLLYEVSLFDPIVFGATASILAAVALLGVVLPARRAARIDPIIAIRGAE